MSRFNILFTAIRTGIDHTVQYRNLRIRAPLLVFAVWFVVLYWDGTGFALIGLAASLWHELGHVLCYRILFGSCPLLTISVGGIALSIDEKQMTCGQTMRLAASGPAANFFAAAVVGGLLSRRMTVMGAAVWSANVLMGSFNLLPVPPLDGFRLLCCIREFWANKLHFRNK